MIEFWGSDDRASLSPGRDKQLVALLAEIASTRSPDTPCMDCDAVESSRDSAAGILKAFTHPECAREGCASNSWTDQIQGHVVLRRCGLEQPYRRYLQSAYSQRSLTFSSKLVSSRYQYLVWRCMHTTRLISTSRANPTDESAVVVSGARSILVTDSPFKSIKRIAGVRP